MEDLVDQVVETAEIAEPEVEAETAEKAVEITDTEMEVNLETYSAKKIETVHAVAIFENLTFNGVAQDDLKSLEKFIYSEKQLADNIETLDYKVISNTEVTLQFNVITERLWGNSRQYLCKHLGGDNFWDRQNGTRIQIKRIHVVK